MPTSTPPGTQSDWQRIAVLLAHRLIAAGQMERACAELQELADWEREEGAKWNPSTHGTAAAASSALVQAYHAAAALLRQEDGANPFIRPRSTRPA